jgi:hypothetical protein
MISAILFALIAVILCAAAVLALLGVGQLALSGVDAIQRDGLARGRLAPRWVLADSAGIVRRSPPASPLQLIVFTDHSLKSFPSVAVGLRALCADQAASAERDNLEIVILLRRPSEIAEPALSQLGLGSIPIVTGSPARYADYNVRVIPFAIFVDSSGRVRASSLVNHDWQLAKLRQIAAVPLDAAELAAARRRGSGRVRRHQRQAEALAGADLPAGADARAQGGTPAEHDAPATTGDRRAVADTAVAHPGWC